MIVWYLYTPVGFIVVCGELYVGWGMARVVRARYENGVLKPLEKLDLREGEEVIIRIERLEERRRALRELRGALGPASRELLDRFMLEAEAQ